MVRSHFQSILIYECSKIILRFRGNPFSGVAIYLLKVSSLCGRWSLHSAKQLVSIQIGVRLEYIEQNAVCPTLSHMISSCNQIWNWNPWVVQMCKSGDLCHDHLTMCSLDMELMTTYEDKTPILKHFTEHDELQQWIRQQWISKSGLI